METGEQRVRPTVILVCGSPGAGKTTVAEAVAMYLTVPLLARDRFKRGLGLSSGALSDELGSSRSPSFDVAGGLYSQRAEEALVEASAALARRQISHVVENSLISDDLIDALLGHDARLVAIRVVASDAEVTLRLKQRATSGRGVDAQLLAQFIRGEMTQAMFDPPPRIAAQLEIDTTSGTVPDGGHISTAALRAVR